MSIRGLIAKHFRSFRLYMATGVLSYGLNLTLMFALLEGAQLNPKLAFAITLACLIVFNFFVGRHVIFNATDGSAGRQFLRFVGTSGTARLIEWALFSVLIDATGLHPMLVNIGVLGSSFCVKYVVYRRLVFARAAA